MKYCNLIILLMIFSVGCNQSGDAKNKGIEDKYWHSSNELLSSEFRDAYKVVLDDVQGRQKMQVKGIALTALDGNLIIARVDTGDKQIGMIVSQFTKPNGEDYWQVDKTPLSSNIFSALLANKKVANTLKKLEDDANRGDESDRPDY